MGFKAASDYSINKRTEDIVYVYANGESDRYIKEKDAAGKPTGRILLKHRSSNGIETIRVLSESEMTVEQFDQVKAFSDANYHEIDKGDIRYQKYTVPLNAASDSVMLDFQDSAEDEFFKAQETDEADDPRTTENALDILDACMTKKQKKRFIAYYYEGKTQDEIAAEEGTLRTAIEASLELAKKNLRLFLRKKPNYTVKMASKKMISEGTTKTAPRDH